MFVVGNLLVAVAKLSDMILSIFYWLILIRALLSWVNPDPFNPIVRFLENVTEPILRPIRRLLPYTPLDLSPLIAFFIILFLKWFLVSTLFDLGLRLK